MKKVALLMLLLTAAASGVALFLRERGNYTFDLDVKKLPLEIASVAPLHPNADIGPQQPLGTPPVVIKAAYLTSWAAGSAKKSAYMLRLLKDTELNAVVVDLKDFTGTVSYITNVPDVKKYNAEERRIPRINTLIKTLHDEGVYVIGRIAVFEDQKLPVARPELALQSKTKEGAWKDYKGLMWLDTASRDVWDYNIAIAKDALARGIDEINFDYIRFASDGDLKDIRYPIWNGQTPKKEVLRQFFAYLRESLPDAKLSADLFGMTTTNKDDLNIGQYLEYALPYFDAVSPMVYPSHYGSGFIGIKNPASAPYEVVRYSLDEAVKRMKEYQSARDEAQRRNLTAEVIGVTTPVPLPMRAKLRPWLQDFNLGATYDAEKVQTQIRATDDTARECLKQSGVTETGAPICDGLIHRDAIDGRFIGGWMLWNSGSTYTEEALQIE
ncbi:MAG: putative glycoside hydrolase [bacterium]|nr:putative glycoside hydrolase [bacterium]